MAGRTDHAERCRKCPTIDVTARMVQASKVLKRGNARGWFCPACADRYDRLDAGIQQLGTPKKPRRT